MYVLSTSKKFHVDVILFSSCTSLCMYCLRQNFHVDVISVSHKRDCCWLSTLNRLCCIRNIQHRLRTFRELDGSDTQSTDSDIGWGGLGMFEYGQKGLPHALVHTRELVETYGHHGACCTCLGEAGHKSNIKNASKFARVYADRNDTQDGMLEYVQRQQLWTAISEMQPTERDIADMSTNATADSNDTSSSERTDDTNRHADTPSNESGERTDDTNRHVDTPSNEQRLRYKLREPLSDLTKDWPSMRAAPGGQPPPTWDAKFLSKRLLITQTELVTLLRTKLEMEETWENITLLATQLQWECYGSLVIVDRDDKIRKVVGTSNVSRERRDFVRVRGHVDNTALGVQV